MTERENPTGRLTEARFMALLEAYGADFGRWPELEREAAHGFVAVRPDLAGAVDEERLLDNALRASVEMAASADLRARVLAAAPDARRASPALRRRILAAAPDAARLAESWWAAVWPFGPIWRPVAALAAAALLGMYIGGSEPQIIFGQPAQAAEIPEEMVIVAEVSVLGLEDFE